jgi:hypothetical protein
LFSIKKPAANLKWAHEFSDHRKNRLILLDSLFLNR